VFKIKNKNLIITAAVVLLLLLISSSILALKTPFVFTLKQPFNILNFFQRQFGALVFFERNYLDNQRLVKENGFLKNKLNSLREAQLENERLKKILAFKQKSGFKLIAARVIARSPDSWSSSVIIDKGNGSGIKKGMPALTYLGLLGRVVEVQGPSAKIMLVTDPNLSVSAVVQRSRQEGLVSGTLGANLIMRYLPEEADIKVNDLIVSSGLNETYPKGLLIGTVIDIGKEFSGMSRFAIIRPAVNLSSIEEALIIVQ
jgi:rod shape-determining protein MreC